MSSVTELGYLGMSVTDLDAWRAYATEVAGMEVVDEGEGDRIYLRMDLWHHRIVLHKGDTDDLAYMGWRLGDPTEFEAMVEKLTSAGVAVTVASDAEARERRVLGLAKLTDPGGNPTEIFYGPQVDAHRPFHPGRAMFGKFVTGSEGIGHCILRQDDVEAAAAFYRLLGCADRLNTSCTCPTAWLPCRTSCIAMNGSTRSPSASARWKSASTI